MAEKKIFVGIVMILPLGQDARAVQIRERLKLMFPVKRDEKGKVVSNPVQVLNPGENAADEWSRTVREQKPDLKWTGLDFSVFVRYDNTVKVAFVNPTDDDVSEVIRVATADPLLEEAIAMDMPELALKAGQEKIPDVMPS